MMRARIPGLSPLRGAVAALGIAIAAAGARMFTSSISNLLFEVTPNDPTVVLGASALLLVAGLLAAWLPARRAARVDPADALRG